MTAVFFAALLLLVPGQRAIAGPDPYGIKLTPAERALVADHLGKRLPYHDSIVRSIEFPELLRIFNYIDVAGDRTVALIVDGEWIDWGAHDLFWISEDAKRHVFRKRGWPGLDADKRKMLALRSVINALPPGFIGAQPPPDLTVTYESSSGTVSPQYYEVRRITVRSTGVSDILVVRGTVASGTKEHKASFTPDAAKLSVLMDYIRSNHLDAPPPVTQDAPPRLRPRPGEGRCTLKLAARGNTYTVACDRRGVPPLLKLIREIVPASATQASEPAAPRALVPPLSFRGGIPDVASVSIKLDADFTYVLYVMYASIKSAGRASTQQGRWSYDKPSALVALYPDDRAAKQGSLAITFSSPLAANLVAPDVISMNLALVPAGSQGDKPLTEQERRAGKVLKIGIETVDGHYLTAAGGGGYGGANEGPDAVALRSDAVHADASVRFDWIWLDKDHTRFALKTMKGTFLTAVNGGGIGGPNDGRSPFHTDAKALGPDEVFRVHFDAGGKVTLRTRKGFYMSAVNGGGYGGPNTVPLHTDATSIGPWETFQLAVSRDPM